MIRTNWVDKVGVFVVFNVGKKSPSLSSIHWRHGGERGIAKSLRFLFVFCGRTLSVVPSTWWLETLTTSPKRKPVCAAMRIAPAHSLVVSGWSISLRTSSVVNGARSVLSFSGRGLILEATLVFVSPSSTATAKALLKAPKSQLAVAALIVRSVFLIRVLVILVRAFSTSALVRSARGFDETDWPKAVVNLLTIAQ